MYDACVFVYNIQITSKEISYINRDINEALNIYFFLLY